MISFLSLPYVKKLIIADDDPDDQALLKESLEEIGNIPEIKTVFDGAQLMRTIQSDPLPDLVLLDLNMPYKNGVECLAEIRKSRHLKTLPVVVLSTSREIRDVELCYESGAHLFFQKPNTFNALKGLLETLLYIDWNHFPKHIGKEEFIRISKRGLPYAVVHSA